MCLDRKAGTYGRDFETYLDSICRPIISPNVEKHGFWRVYTDLGTYGPTSSLNRLGAEPGLRVGCGCETQAETHQRANSEKSA